MAMSGADEVAKVAAGLTKAQRDWLLRHQDRLHTDATFEALALEGMGLAKPVYCPTAQDFGHIATRKGLEVRRILERQDHADQ